MSIVGNAILLGGGETLPDAGGVSFGGTYAFIHVTYPEGSTCTCTKGNTTLTAEDTSGNYTFVIEVPSSGTDIWTVSCTDGTDSSSDTVEISVAEIVNIELSYITLISFYLSVNGESSTLQAELGMTWAEYIDSPYNNVNTIPNYPLSVNTWGYVVYNIGYTAPSVRDVIDWNDIQGDTEIIEGHTYAVISSGGSGN